MSNEITSGIETLSGNGALKYLSSGSVFVDQFANASKYKAPRPFEIIAADMETSWKEDPLTALKFVFYLRIITRVVQFADGMKTTKVQKGQGLKHEAISRMMWIHHKYPETFWKNIQLFIAVGSWKDIIVMLAYDIQASGWEKRRLNWNQFGTLILAGLENQNTTNLLKKYLPQIKTNSRCKTIAAKADNIIAKWICSLIFGEKVDGSTYKAYRKLKTSGTAHEWQKLISKRLIDLVDFDSIHGRALSLLVSSKFLQNQKLEEKYEKWILSKPVAKFTGYVYELIAGKNAHIKNYVKYTIDAQFQTLVNLAKTKVNPLGFRPISVLDCSSSMNSPMYIGSGQIGKMSAWEVACASAIYFDSVLDNNPLKNKFLVFSSVCHSYEFTGNTFTEKYFNLSRPGWGGTNFQSVFDFFVNFRIDHPDVSEKLIPNLVVCFSDGEFNRVINNGLITNVEAGRQKLIAGGYSKEFADEFGICFVDLPNTFYGRQPATKFETFKDTKNVFYFSGFDLSPLNFLFGDADVSSLEVKVPSSAEELFYAAMDQEIQSLLVL